MLIKLIPILSILILSPVTLAENYIVGQLVPEKNVIVRSEVSGIINSYNYDNGDNIDQGEELLLLSAKDYALNVKLAKYEVDVSKSELEAQEKQLQRYQSLFKGKGISASDLDNQIRITNIGRAQFNVSKTQYEIAKRTFDKSTPNSPFSGVIINRTVELGQFISVGDPLYTIADISKLKVRFYLLEVDFTKVTKGDEVKVIIPSIEKSFIGKVTLLSPAFMENEPGFLVEVTLANSNEQLKPGMESHVYFNEEDVQ